MIRIAIVEDEEASVALLQKYISRYEKREDHVFSCDCYKNGLDFISDYKPVYDLIFMDIDMPQLDGMESSRRLRKLDQNVALVFVTNLRQYAIKGYEVNALDFIVKPVEYYDFVMKMDKAIAYAQKHKNDSIVIHTGDSEKIISISNLHYVEVRSHWLIYHTVDGNFEVYGQLNTLEEALKPSGFVKCSHSYLVNLRYVMAVYADSIQVNQESVPLSRRKKKEFMQELANYHGGGYLS